MTRFRSPSGAEWIVVEESEDAVTVDLDRLPDGSLATLTNLQTYSLAEIEAADGWRVVA